MVDGQSTDRLRVGNFNEQVWGDLRERDHVAAVRRNDELAGFVNLDTWIGHWQLLSVEEAPSLANRHELCRVHDAITPLPQGGHGRTRHWCPPGISHPSGEATLAAIMRRSHPSRVSPGRGSPWRGRRAARPSGVGQPVRAPQPEPAGARILGAAGSVAMCASAVAGAAPYAVSAHGFSAPAAATCGLAMSVSSRDGSAKCRSASLGCDHSEAGDRPEHVDRQPETASSALLALQPE